MNFEKFLLTATDGLVLFSYPMKVLKIGHFTCTVVCSVTWPLNGSEAGGCYCHVNGPTGS